MSVVVPVVYGPHMLRFVERFRERPTTCDLYRCALCLREAVFVHGLLTDPSGRHGEPPWSTEVCQGNHEAYAAGLS